MVYLECAARCNSTQQEQMSCQSRGTNSEEDSPTIPSAMPLGSPIARLPEFAFSFFKDVSPEGYPEGEVAAPKVQPWRNIWEGPKPSPDGRLLVALPRRVDFGSNNLGGY